MNFTGKAYFMAGVIATFGTLLAIHKIMAYAGIVNDWLLVSSIIFLVTIIGLTISIKEKIQIQTTIIKTEKGGRTYGKD